MGNRDLVIIINDEAVIDISGKRYINREKAVLIAMTEWGKSVDKIKKECDFPEEIVDVIDSIKIFNKLT